MALQRVGDLEQRLERVGTPVDADVPDAAQLRLLSTRLPEIWNAPTTDMKVKQRIARILIKEVICDVDEDRREGVVVIHWAGGRHTEVRIPRNRAPTQTVHQPNAVEVVQVMAGRFPDREIANTLNRARRGTRQRDGTWTELRLRELREELGLPAFDASTSITPVVARDEAAARLGICVGSVRVLIDRGVLPAEQVVSHAPWRIPVAALQDERVLTEVRAIQERRPMNLAKYRAQSNLVLPGVD